MQLFLFLFVFISSNHLAGNYSLKKLLAEEMKTVRKSENAVIVSNPKTPVPENGLKKRIIFMEDLSIGVEAREI